MTQKTILITGCSSGIGYACAHYLRAQGWRVFASCRKSADCTRLRDEGFESPLIDYADDATIQSGLAETIAATGGTLDAVFNNGAFASPGLAQDIPREALREIFETNLFGVHELTRSVLCIMRAQGHGRIVQCSSVLGFVAARARMPYVATKFALEGMTDVYRLEEIDPNIHHILIEPGPVTSKIRINSQPHFEKWIDWENLSSRSFYENVFLPRLYDNSGKKDRFELPADAVARKLEHAISSRRPRPRYFVTTPTYIAAWIKRLLPTRAQDFFFRGN